MSVRRLVGGVTVMIGAVAAACLPACFDISFPVDIRLLDNVSPFVLRGTAAVVDNDGPCRVWYGENGIAYHLFQSRFVDSETFDRVIEPGTTARLVLAERGDLELACAFGTIVEVQDVLEIEGQ